MLPSEVARARPSLATNDSTLDRAARPHPHVLPPDLNHKLYIRTFGCQMNEYDSDRMADVLAASDGLTLTARPDDADVILFNTCSVREKAQERVFHDLGRVRGLKAQRPDLIIGVGGCVASQEGAAIVERAPYVDLVFGPQTLHRLPEMIRARRASGEPQVDISFPEIEKFDHLPPPAVDGASAFVSIMEGCSKYCSFCIVPYTRGEEVSRPLGDVLTEIADLALQGVKEVTLLGQNVNAYREYFGRHRRRSRGPRAAARIRGGDSRHRAPALHDLAPARDEPAADPCLRQASEARLAPAPAGAVGVGPDPCRNEARLHRSRIQVDRAPPASRAAGRCRSRRISSSAFPGETEADFARTLKLVEEIGFDGAFSFAYSARPGTPAAELPDRVPAAIAQAAARSPAGAARRAIPRRAATQWSAACERVLVTGRSAKDAGELAGRTDNNRVINFKGDATSIGRYVDVVVTAALAHCLRGTRVVTVRRARPPEIPIASSPS